MVATVENADPSGVPVRPPFLTLLRNQHLELVRRIDRIRVLAAHREHTPELRHELVGLRAATNHHLACEDNLFYAVLRHHRDPVVRQHIKEAQGLAVDTAPAFLRFCDRWVDDPRIAEWPLGFWLALERITNDVRLRIAREEREVYPFIERHA